MTNVRDAMKAYYERFGEAFEVFLMPVDNEAAAAERLEQAVRDGKPIAEADFNTEFGIKPIPDGADL